MESDEAFARRLQAQEMGLQLQALPDAQTPLMRHQNQEAENRGNNNQNPTVLNARLNEISGARTTLCAILTVNTPQILAAAIVLSLHWNDTSACDDSHTSKWKAWAATSATRMFLYSTIVTMMYIFKPYLQDRPRLAAQVTNIRNVIDALGLIWFVVGNMWLIGDPNDSCRNPLESPIYDLCISMLIINYIQICLPCIIAVVLIPVFCFCMPCLIRVLARLQNRRGATQGASEQAIRQLPITTIIEEHLSEIGEDHTCPICLNEMVVGEEARLLQCKHIFHKHCVDEWLRVNASCPTCRKNIFDESDGDGQGRGRLGTGSNSDVGAPAAAPAGRAASLGTATQSGLGDVSIGNGPGNGPGNGQGNGPGGGSGADVGADLGVEMSSLPTGSNRNALQDGL